MNKIKLLFLIFIVLLLGSVVAAGYFYWQWNILKKNPESITENANKQLIKDLGKIILLPDELPTVATVTDPSLLSDQPFFANAKVGHKVLVFPLAKKAILYDPTLHMVIEVGPINTTEPPPSDAVSPQIEENP